MSSRETHGPAEGLDDEPSSPTRTVESAANDVIRADTAIDEAVQAENDAEDAANVRSGLGIADDRERMDEADIFSISDADHALVRQFRPTYLARGGNQIVYDLPDLPDVVAKADTQLLRMNLERNVRDGKPADELSDKDVAMKYLRDERKRMRRMRGIFGKDHVLAQAKVLRKVPVNARILGELYDGSPPAIVDEAWTAIALQRRAVELDDPDRLDLVGGYAELNGGTDDALYARVTRSLLDESSDDTPSIQEFLAVQNNDRLNALVEAAERDPGLKESLRGLVATILRYARETGETLDIAGSDNIVFFQKGGKWRYRLIDALSPGESDTLEKGRAAVRKAAEGISLDKDEEGCLLNVLNFTRTINGLCAFVGIDEKINMLPRGTRTDSLDYKAALKGIIDRNTAA